MDIDSNDNQVKRIVGVLFLLRYYLAKKILIIADVVSVADFHFPFLFVSGERMISGNLSHKFPQRISFLFRWSNYFSLARRR